MYRVIIFSLFFLKLSFVYANKCGENLAVRNIEVIDFKEIDELTLELKKDPYDLKVRNKISKNLFSKALIFLDQSKTNYKVLEGRNILILPNGNSGLNKISLDVKEVMGEEFQLIFAADLLLNNFNHFDYPAPTTRYKNIYLDSNELFNQKLTERLKEEISPPRNYSHFSGRNKKISLFMRDYFSAYHKYIKRTPKEELEIYDEFYNIIKENFIKSNISFFEKNKELYVSNEIGSFFVINPEYIFKKFWNTDEKIIESFEYTADSKNIYLLNEDLEQANYQDFLSTPWPGYTRELLDYVQYKKRGQVNILTDLIDERKFSEYLSLEEQMSKASLTTTSSINEGPKVLKVNPLFFSEQDKRKFDFSFNLNYSSHIHSREIVTEYDLKPSEYYPLMANSFRLKSENAFHLRLNHKNLYLVDFRYIPKTYDESFVFNQKEILDLYFKQLKDPDGIKKLDKFLESKDLRFFENNNSYFYEYLKFIKEVYSRKIDEINDDRIDKLLEISKSLKERSIVFLNSNSHKGLNDSNDIQSGCIAVVSRDRSEPLPLEITEGIVLERPRDIQGRVRPIVELGRYSKDSNADKDLLNISKIIGSYLFMNDNIPARIYIEADSKRSRLFKRYGFKILANHEQLDSKYIGKFNILYIEMEDFWRFNLLNFK